MLYLLSIALVLPALPSLSFTPLPTPPSGPSIFSLTPTPFSLTPVPPSSALLFTLPQPLMLSFPQASLTPLPDGPSPRTNPCTASLPPLVYLYGGMHNSTQLQDLWMLDTSSYAWSYLGDSPQQVMNCQIVAVGDEVWLLGRDNTSALTILHYATQTGIWTQQSYNYGESVSKTGMTYTSTIQTSQLPMSTLLIDVPYNHQDLHHISTLVIGQFCLTAIPGLQGQYLLVTATTMLLWDVNAMEIEFVRGVDGEGVQCVCTGDWLLLFREGHEQDTLDMRYYQVGDQANEGEIEYPMANIGGGFRVLLLGTSIYVVRSSPFAYSTLTQHCQHPSPTCFFQFSLSPSTPCPNSLTLLDPSTHTLLRHECSSHGTCLNGTCMCEQLWTGPDCSIYQRRQCAGKLEVIWPVSNCECEQQIRGGNNCEVVFCYNDCSGHGECGAAGECRCQQGYYGRDCSIVVIGFPGAQVTI